MLPLEYPPRTQSIYSDLGFILLAFIVEDVGKATFAARLRRVEAAARAGRMAGLDCALEAAAQADAALATRLETART